MSVPVTAQRAAEPISEADVALVETSAGWQLTLTLTDRLREALARGIEGRPDHATFTVRIAPNLVPGEAFPADLVLRAADESRRPSPREPVDDRAEGRR